MLASGCQSQQHHSLNTPSCHLCLTCSAQLQRLLRIKTEGESDLRSRLEQQAKDGLAQLRSTSSRPCALNLTASRYLLLQPQGCDLTVDACHSTAGENCQLLPSCLVTTILTLFYSNPDLNDHAAASSLLVLCRLSASLCWTATVQDLTFRPEVSMASRRCAAALNCSSEGI